jgi:hypothetical protein
MENFNDYFLIDSDAQDAESVKKMIVVNTCAINWLEFDADIMDYLDALSDASIDPYEHLQDVQEQLIQEKLIIL